MGSIGTPELIIGLIVIFLLFGAKRMPEAARGLGRSLKIFKSEMQGPDKADDKLDTPAQAQPPTPAPAPVQVVLPPAEPTTQPPMVVPVPERHRAAEPHHREV